MSIQINPCNKLDARAAGELAKELWADHAFPGSFYRQAVDSFGDSVFVAKTDEGKVVGYGVGLKEPYGDSAWILSVAVHPDYRKSGVGTMFLETFTAFFKERGVRSICATIDPANEASLTMCNKFGFVEVSREDDYFGEGLAQIRVELVL